jgi:hypothetical protein
LEKISTGKARIIIAKVVMSEHDFIKSAKGLPERVVKRYCDKRPCRDVNTFELLATTGVLPRARPIRRTTRGTSTLLPAVVATRTTTIRTISLGFAVSRVLNKIKKKYRWSPIKRRLVFMHDTGY